MCKAAGALADFHHNQPAPPPPPHSDIIRMAAAKRREGGEVEVEVTTMIGGLKVSRFIPTHHPRTDALRGGVAAWVEGLEILQGTRVQVDRAL